MDWHKWLVKRYMHDINIVSRLLVEIGHSSGMES